MSKLDLIDDILAPSDRIKLVLECKNPFVIFSLFPRLIRDVMKITGKDTYETDVRWDTTSDPRGFYGVWMGIRNEDKWTKTYIRTIAQGEMSLKDKTGNITLEIKGFIRTSYDYSNFFQHSFWWFYNRSFYNKQRRAYIEFAKDNIFQIRDIVLKTAGMLEQRE